MRTISLFLLLALACSTFSCSGAASHSSAAGRNGHDGHDHAAPLPLESPEKETVKLTENGFEPRVITLRKLDGSIFFVNTTRAGLATLEVAFGAHRAHCASDNMKFENGKMSSIKPVGPRDFALMCFPDKGTYSMTVRGVDGTAKAFTGSVIVE